MQSKKYTFERKGKNLAQDVAIITGVARSGTTILGKIIGSFERVEYEYQPWLLAQLPVLERDRLITFEAACELLKGYANDLLTNHILGRNVNMRPTDDSAVWNSLERKELERRWREVQTRKDVQETVLRQKNILAMKMVNLLPYYEFLLRAFPQGKIVHIVRDGLHVALSIKKKGWVSDAALQNVESMSIGKEIHDGAKKYYVPFWVNDEDAQWFLESSEMTRALYYWRNLMEQGMNNSEGLNLNASKNYLEIRYEQLLQDPSGTTTHLADFLQTSYSALTQGFVDSIRREKLHTRPDWDAREADPREWNRFKRVMQKFGYGIPEGVTA